MSMASVLQDRSIDVILCVGAGGVGKTTTAAALGVQAAHFGRKVCVLTVDPARRLSSALGIDSATNDFHQPQKIALENAQGEMSIVMLDSQQTFTELIRTYASNETQADAILANRIFSNIATSMGGTHDYMAMEKLYELHELSHPDAKENAMFDLVIVDTAPSTNANDFIEAPNRITNFLNHRLYKVLVTPKSGFEKIINVAAQSVLRTVGKLVGAKVVDDVIDFFANFDGMEESFRHRAMAVNELLRAPSTTCALVLVPREDVVTESARFTRYLENAGIHIQHVVANRVHPKIDPALRSALLARSESDPQWHDLICQSVVVADDEAQAMQMFAAQIGEIPVTTIPSLESDVHDLAGVMRIGGWLGEIDSNG